MTISNLTWFYFELPPVPLRPVKVLPSLKTVKKKKTFKQTDVDFLLMIIALVIICPFSETEEDAVRHQKMLLNNFEGKKKDKMILASSFSQFLLYTFIFFLRIGRLDN